MMSVATSRLKATGVDQARAPPRPHTFRGANELIGVDPTLFQKRRLVVLVRLPKTRPKGQQAFAVVHLRVFLS
jgi:NMD protein affecting ribosome stability and mRNA decay